MVTITLCSLLLIDFTNYAGVLKNKLQYIIHKCCDLWQADQERVFTKWECIGDFGALPGKNIGFFYVKKRFDEAHKTVILIGIYFYKNVNKFIMAITSSFRGKSLDFFVKKRYLMKLINSRPNAH